MCEKAKQILKILCKLVTLCLWVFQNGYASTPLNLETPLQGALSRTNDQRKFATRSMHWVQRYVWLDG